MRTDSPISPITVNDAMVAAMIAEALGSCTVAMV